MVAAGVDRPFSRITPTLPQPHAPQPQLFPVQNFVEAQRCWTTGGERIYTQLA